MDNNIKVDLGPVQETLLIPLLARAEETKKDNGLLSDPKAVEITKAVNYDFSKWHGKQTLIGASIRAHIFDQLVSDFLKQNPKGTVIEIGAGLNTRFERLDNGQAQWLELDLPDSMTLRRQFFEENDRRKMIAGSFLETDWHDKVLSYPTPYCFVSEAVIIYLNHQEIEKAFRVMTAKFPGAQLIMDTCSSNMVESQHKHDIMKTMPKESWFQWKCDDPKSTEEWGMELNKSLTFLDMPKEIHPKIPMIWRLMLRFTPWLVKKMVSGYRINLYHFISS